MKGLEIHDTHSKGFLAFDLKEILQCLGEDALERMWVTEGVECAGDASQPLETVRGIIRGKELLKLAQSTEQTIWGTFSGRTASETSHSIVIKAIDSSLWEVFADKKYLEKVRRSFRSVVPAGYNAS